MTAPRWEICQTSADQPWHARFRSSNGALLMHTEKYARRRGALRAIELVAGCDVYYSPFQEWPEIYHGNGPTFTLIEIRDVDLRAVGS